MGIEQNKDIGNGGRNGLEDLERPFIEKNKMEASEDDENGAGAGAGDKGGSMGMLFLSTAVAVGYSAPAQASIREDLHLSLAQYSMFGSILTIGAMIGAVSSGRISDSIGRKGAMRLSACSCITGWLAVYLSMDGARIAGSCFWKSTWRILCPRQGEVMIFYEIGGLEIPMEDPVSPTGWRQQDPVPGNPCRVVVFRGHGIPHGGSFLLDTGRFLTGYGIGIFSFVVPVFIAEIAPKNLRGGLTTLNQLMIVTGSSVTFLMGTVITWRVLALTGKSRRAQILKFTYG
ncbi:hypothetical protein U1Q18_030032 [Sarracenia purpurea var. burkii]